MPLDLDSGSQAAPGFLRVESAINPFWDPKGGLRREEPQRNRQSWLGQGLSGTRAFWEMESCTRAPASEARLFLSPFQPSCLSSCPHRHLAHLTVSKEQTLP